jgi:3-isopropylmalate dehydrogenase
LKKFKAGDIDFLIVRESTEGLFSARQSKFDTQKEESSDAMRITRKGSERICRAAFRQALLRRKQSTLVDKANVLPSMVYFRSVFDAVSKEFPTVQAEHCGPAWYSCHHSKTDGVLVGRVPGNGRGM